MVLLCMNSQEHFFKSEYIPLLKQLLHILYKHANHHLKQFNLI